MNRPSAVSAPPRVSPGGPLATRHAVTALGPADAPVMMFAHGFGCDQGMWDAVVPALGADHRVVLFDLLGSGRSRTAGIDPERYTGFEPWVADLLSLIEELELHDVTLVAHSVSAMMAIAAAVERPELFRQIVLVAPSPCFVDDPDAGYRGGFSAEDLTEVLASLDSNYFTWAAAAAPSIMGNPDTPQLAADLEASFCRTDPDFARALAHATFTADVRPLLPQVSTPTLLLECRDDAWAPPEVAEHLREHIVASVGVQLLASGHCPHISAPEETAAAIRANLLTLR